MTSRRLVLTLLAIVAISIVVRLPHWNRPMADSLQAKQVYVANRARNIAQPPFNAFRSSFDFLDADGHRLEFTEEFPAYTTILAVGYRVFGEAAWVGHALSLIGSIAAILAFFALVRQEWDDLSALIATLLLSIAPIFVFYGRAVMPDPWMLALMLASAASYRRYLDYRDTRWLVVASLAAMGAGLFKYFGLIVFLPLAEMAWRNKNSWRGVWSRSFLGMFAAATLPMGLWMILVFFRTANPVKSGWLDGQVMPYLVFQAPGVILSKAFTTNLLGRFLIRDCGPIAAVLIGLDVVSRIRRPSEKSGLVLGWTVMAAAYYVLLAPKLRDHDYYELVMLPAAALWATRGLMCHWSYSTNALPIRGKTGRVRPVALEYGRSASRLIAMTLLIATIVQSPWIMGTLFRQDEGKVILAERLRALSLPGSKVVAIGPGIEFPTVIHYSHREGWPIHSPRLPANWRERLSLYQDSGASLVAVYFEPKATQAERDSYAPLLQALPVIERRAGLKTRLSGTSEYFILDLRPPQIATRLPR